jgi:uncharacterized protein (TIGR00297 family)
VNALTTMLIAPPLWLALLLSAAFAAIAWKARWLTASGAAATFVVGAIIFGLGGGKFAVPLLTFFLTSSLLSRLGRAQKLRTALGEVKGATRDAGQVLANGGVAAAIILIYAVVVHLWPIYETRRLLMLYLAALATVNADTWATELGALSPGSPRLLSNWRPAPAGTSGAISAMGTLAALAGAVVIPLSVLWLWNLDAVEFFAVAWAGFVGSFVDSLLGASLQAVYRNPVTGQLTERRRLAGQPMPRARGLRWVNNDVVNLLASLFGALCAWGLLRLSAGN